MLYGTKRNDGSTPYYLPRIVNIAQNGLLKTQTKRGQRQKVNAIS